MNSQTLTIVIAFALMGCTEATFEDVGKTNGEGKLASVDQVEQNSETKDASSTNINEKTDADFPEPVSGAYLACVITDEGREDRQAIGCNLYKDAARTIADIRDFESQWTVIDDNGKSIGFSISYPEQGIFKVVLWVLKVDVPRSRVKLTVQDPARKAEFVTAPSPQVAATSTPVTPRATPTATPTPSPTPSPSPKPVPPGAPDPTGFLTGTTTSFNCRSKASYLTPSGANGVIVDFDRLEINTTTVPVVDLVVKLNGLDTGSIKANNAYMYQLKKASTTGVTTETATISTGGKSVTITMNHNVRAPTQPATDACVYQFSLVVNAQGMIVLSPDL